MGRPPSRTPRRSRLGLHQEAGGRGPARPGAHPAPPTAWRDGRRRAPRPTRPRRGTPRLQATPPGARACHPAGSVSSPTGCSEIALLAISSPADAQCATPRNAPPGGRHRATHRPVGDTAQRTAQWATPRHTPPSTQHPAPQVANTVAQHADQVRPQSAGGTADTNRGPRTRHGLSPVPTSCPRSPLRVPGPHFLFAAPRSRRRLGPTLSTGQSPVRRIRGWVVLKVAASEGGTSKPARRLRRGAGGGGGEGAGEGEGEPVALETTRLRRGAPRLQAAQPPCARRCRAPGWAPTPTSAPQPAAVTSDTKRGPRTWHDLSSVPTSCSQSREAAIGRARP